ncbi:MAG: cytochrome c [Bacteroidetes bacterium]|nr:MAG: cytochrome c [Bacteroidota bacterium]
MKKSVKIVLFSLLGIILVLFVIAMYVNISGIPSYENQAEELVVEVTPERVAEGARIAAVMCASCHGSTDGKLGGSFMADASDFGEVHAPNITQHPQFGITQYTDGELVYLLRTGIRRDGQYVPPWMPKFPLLSDEDIYSIVAFLHSDHPQVQPSDLESVPVNANFLAKMLSRTVFKPLPYPESPIEAPDRSDKVAYGRYLSVAKFDCYSCHSASFKAIDMMVPENTEGFFGGGNKLYDRDLKEIYSPNLTMSKETGLGDWSEGDFIRTLRYGMRPDNTPLRYPMAPAPMITDEEASAIWVYLQTVPVIENKVPRVEQTTLR